MKFPFFDFKKKNSSNALKAYLKQMMSNAIVLQREELTEEPPIGTSKIGGIPHLPADFQWPRYEAEGYDEEWKDRPLSFVAQIDVGAVAAFDRDHRLPKQGFLYFFYDVISQKWGFDPEDAGCARVYYYDIPADALQETELPEDLEEEARVPLFALSFERKEELPDYEEFCALTDTEQFGEDFDWDSYDEVLEKLLGEKDYEPDEVCKLLGHADLIQSAMLEECARVAMGLYCGNAEAYENTTEAQEAAIAADARNWTLLAQFGTLSDEIMFGDCGCIYFYIRKEDLAAARFDRIWLCLQCG